MRSSEYQGLLLKLDEFIRKYYKNQLIRGFLYGAGMLLAFYLLVVLLEYYGQFDTTVRSILFYSFILLNGWLITTLIIVPLLHLYKIGKIISNEQAAQIIGNHFQNVQDKLLNVLQLQSQAIAEGRHMELVMAGIDQKIKELKPVSFTGAINLGENKKYLVYLIVPALAFILLMVQSPEVLSGSTERLLKHSEHFERQAPFRFVIQNAKLEAAKNEDFLLEVEMQGNVRPQEVFIDLGGREYKLSRDGKDRFSYLFRNLQENTTFTLAADGFSSSEYELKALPKPLLMNFSIHFEYPKYLGQKNEELKNTGDLIIPEGTKVTWNLHTENARQMAMNLNDSVFSLQPVDDNLFQASWVFLKNASYSLSASNEFMTNQESVKYAVNVIADQHPVIEVDEKKDSVFVKQLYFAGSVQDDHGFTDLRFQYRILKNGGGELRSVKLPLTFGQNRQTFFHYWDMAEVGLEPGSEIEYYFEVWDNDGVNGAKSARTQSRIFRAPTSDELEASTEKNNEELKREMEEGIKQAKDLQKEMQDLYKKVLEKKELSWEEKKKLEELLKEQKELEQRLQEISQENKQNSMQQQEFSKPDESMLEKQNQLQQLMEQLMTDEMKKLMEEMQKMMDQMDKQKLQDMLEKMELSNKDIEKELDRTLELFKKMELDQKIERTIDKLDELSRKQDDLAEESQDKKADEDKLKQKQDSLNKEFEKIKEDIKDIEEKNSQLEDPENLPDTKKEQEEINKDMKNASDELEQNKKKDASKSQKGASQKMNQLSQKMSEAMSSMSMEQEAEDEQALRDILNNLLQLSFDQEELMRDLEKIKQNNPQYIELSQRQRKLKDDAKMIEDSLLALSKRQPDIESVVNREIAAINSNMERSIGLMGKREDRFAPEIASRQQFSMTSINNLALMLNESLNQMQANCKKQAGSCSKPGTCKKPGHGAKSGDGKMSMKQQQLKKQMEEMLKSMEKGKKDGGKMPGGWSQDLVKMAAQQEALKQMLNQLKKEGGINPGDMENTLKMIEESQKDVVNNRLNQETLKRQDQILEKLLDYEKAQKERETEQKRRAEQAKNDFRRNLSDFSEYNKRKEKEAELLKTVPPSFKGFYKNKVAEYFNNFADDKK